MNSPIDPLDELLSRALAAPEPPADLAARIRRQIDARPAPAPPTWTARLEAVFARPSFAAAFITACVLLGLFLAEARLSRWQAARGAEMARSYVQLIDPLLTAPPSSATRSP